MKTEHPPTPQNAGGPESPAASDASVQAGHEVTDINVLGLTLFGAGLFATVVGVLVAIALMFRIYGAVDNHLDKSLPARETGAASRVKVLPHYDGPLLQVVPEKDLQTMGSSNDSVLTTYGWVDKPKRVVRLPIDRAIALVAERGIPSTSPGHTIEELQQQRAQPQVYGQVLHP